jgi:hypothetical protein
MLRFLGFLLVLSAVVAAIGYYRGWFHAESHDVMGHDSVTLSVDKDKATQDKNSAEQQLQDVTHKN